MKLSKTIIFTYSNVNKFTSNFQRTLLGFFETILNLKINYIKKIVI